MCECCWALGRGAQWVCCRLRRHGDVGSDSARKRVLLACRHRALYYAENPHVSGMTEVTCVSSLKFAFLEHSTRHANKRKFVRDGAWHCVRCYKSCTVRLSCRTARLQKQIKVPGEHVGQVGRSMRHSSQSDGQWWAHSNEARQK